MPEPSSPSVGVLLALSAAAAFGATTPLVHRFGCRVGPFTTAALLYLGAALLALLWPARADREARVQRWHVPRILLVAVAGAVVAPTLLAWGLQRADATSGALILNFEAIFTVLLARLFFREAIGKRVWLAVITMLAGGSLLVVAGARATTGVALGLLAIVLATLAWAADNTLTRPLSNLDPMGVIVRKASLGAFFSAALALASREPIPPLLNAAVLLSCGATGYGLSLRLYLLAQRRMGAARTGSVFAIAPFVGAAMAWVLGEGAVTSSTIVAGSLFGLAVCLHLTEKHAHEHVHDAVEHEHAHRHDDGHHDHAHQPPVAGTHSHPHKHAAQVHAHDHTPDLHHGHRHDGS